MGCSMTVNPEMTCGLPIVENLEVLFREVAHLFSLGHRALQQARVLHLRSDLTGELQSYGSFC